MNNKGRPSTPSFSQYAKQAFDSFTNHMAEPRNYMPSFDDVHKAMKNNPGARRLLALQIGATSIVSGVKHLQSSRKGGTDGY